MTTALILAAGLGQRLRTVTDGPKWLVDIDGRTPAELQLESCADAAGIDRVVVVASPGVDSIAAVVEAHRSLIDIEVVENPDSARWNNWSSALIGLEHIPTGESVLLMNSDVFAGRRWFVDGIGRLVAHDEPALLIDADKTLTDEAMKVAMHGSRLISIGKVGVDRPVGEYVGLAWWPAAHRSSITDLLAAYRQDPKAAQNWYEHAIGQDMDRGTPYRMVATRSSDWVEIDDPSDVEVARSIAADPGASSPPIDGRDPAIGHIALVTNRAYLPWCATTIRSILDSGTARFLRILVVHDGSVTDEGAERLRSMSTPRASIEVTAPGTELTDTLPDIGRFGRSVWLRCLLPDLLPDCSRVLYLDADTLVLEPLDPLLDHDLGGHPIGAVADVMPPEHWDRVVDLGISEPAGYFNSGVLLMDLDRMRADDLGTWVQIVCDAFGPRIHYPDQDVLNIVFAGRWCRLDSRFNAQNRLFMRSRLGEAVVGAAARRTTLAGPTVVHFEGPEVWKPWHAVSIHPFRERYRDALRATPFADVPLVASGRVTQLLNRLPEDRRWPAFWILRRLREKPSAEIARLVRTRTRPDRSSGDLPTCEAALAIHRHRNPADPLAPLSDTDRSIVDRCLPFTDRSTAELIAFVDRTRTEVQQGPASDAFSIDAGSRGGDALVALLVLEEAGAATPLRVMVDQTPSTGRFDAAGVAHLLATVDTDRRVDVVERFT